MTVAPAALVHSAVMAAGHVITGGAVVCTVTVKEQVDVFAGDAWSIAAHVTVVTPTGKTEPEAGAQPTEGLESQRSVAVGVV